MPCFLWMLFSAKTFCKMECATVWFLKMNMPSDWKENVRLVTHQRRGVENGGKEDELFSSGWDSSRFHVDHMKLAVVSNSISAIFWFQRTKRPLTGPLLYHGHVRTWPPHRVRSSKGQEVCHGVVTELWSSYIALHEIFLFPSIWQPP